MKYLTPCGRGRDAGSRSARSGWIEILLENNVAKQNGGPAPRGAGGLKFLRRVNAARDSGPAPRGAGGLKYPYWGSEGTTVTRPAPRGAGGLKFHGEAVTGSYDQSRSARSGWIEITGFCWWKKRPTSRSARSGWIEILEAMGVDGIRAVPLREERVD